MAFFARRMLEIEAKGSYTDILEKELYNGILSGMQLDGSRFFYVNPLEVVPGVSGKLPEYRHVLPKRPQWYTCACCPPNVARLLTSLGQYAWGESDKAVFAHLYLGGEARFKNGAVISCESNYPWNEDVQYKIEEGGQFSFAIHVPAWSTETVVTLNGEPIEVDLVDGYLYIERDWAVGDTVSLKLDLEPRRVYSNAKVRANTYQVALLRGPVVYCVEEVDNGEQLSALSIDSTAAITVEHVEDAALGQISKLQAKSYRARTTDALYSESRPEYEETTLTLVPYYAWSNREDGEMRVWLHER